MVTDPAHRHLYAVTEMTEPGPNPYKTNGYISSFSIDSKTGSLTFLNKVSSGGGGPCHLVVDRSGKILFVANYGSGNVASFAIEPDGRIGAMTGLDQHSGSSIDSKRQQGPHAHAVVLSPDNRFLFVPDLGLDRILIYRVDEVKRTFTPNNPSFVSVKTRLGSPAFRFWRRCEVRLRGLRDGLQCGCVFIRSIKVGSLPPYRPYRHSLLTSPEKITRRRSR